MAKEECEVSDELMKLQSMLMVIGRRNAQLLELAAILEAGGCSACSPSCPPPSTGCASINPSINRVAGHDALGDDRRHASLRHARADERAVARMCKGVWRMTEKGEHSSPGSSLLDMAADDNYVVVGAQVLRDSFADRLARRNVDVRALDDGKLRERLVSMLAGQHADG